MISLESVWHILPVVASADTVSKGKSVQNTREGFFALSLLSPSECYLADIKLFNAPEEYRALFLTAVITGLRLGEVLALRWANVDLQDRRLSVTHSLWRDELLKPKTEASVRTIHLPVSFGQHSAQARAHGFHMFRQSAGSIVHAKTGDLKLAQEMLGHARISTTSSARDRKASGVSYGSYG